MKKHNAEKKFKEWGKDFLPSQKDRRKQTSYQNPTGISEICARSALRCTLNNKTSNKNVPEGYLVQPINTNGDKKTSVRIYETQNASHPMDTSGQLRNLGQKRTTSIKNTNRTASQTHETQPRDVTRLRNTFSQKGALHTRELGLKLIISGRLRGVNMARSFSMSKGSFKPQTLNSYLDYQEIGLKTKWGILGLKIYLAS